MGPGRQSCRRFAHLTHRSGGALQAVRRQRLDRVHDQQPGSDGLGGRQDGIQGGLGQDLDPGPGHAGGQPQSVRPEVELVRRLLTRGVEHIRATVGIADRRRPVMTSDPGRDLQHQRRLADTRLPAEQHQGARHQTAAEHPVDFRDANA